MGVGLTGCVDARDKFGKTWYLDGAGNWGFGIADIAAGLESAGYKGTIDTFIWTTSFNPALDQVNRPGAALRALGLADTISEYLDRFPDNDVNLIALSAGTGVAMWAIENLRDGHQINNLVLLGSSLSYDYDIRKAAKSIKGRIYVYHSRYDSILSGPVRTLGTIDGKLNHNAAGLVGLKPPYGPADKVVNVGWTRRFMTYGWTGAHTDSTNRRFVQAVVSMHIVSPGGSTPSPTTGPAVAITP
jgi:pimeloyl-ACP methyl ester carboxylesterase